MYGYKTNLTRWPVLAVSGFLIPKVGQIVVVMEELPQGVKSRTGNDYETSNYVFRVDAIDHGEMTIDLTHVNQGAVYAPTKPMEHGDSRDEWGKEKGNIMTARQKDAFEDNRRTKKEKPVSKDINVTVKLTATDEARLKALCKEVYGSEPENIEEAAANAIYALVADGLDKYDREKNTGVILDYSVAEVVE